MSERLACVLAALQALPQPYPAFAALTQAIADAAVSSPDYRHVYIYVLDADRDELLMQQTELPVAMSFMISDLRAILAVTDGDVVLSDVLLDMDGQTWREYRVNTDLFIRED